MSNIDSDFRNKAQAVGRVTYGGRPQSPGFYNPDGSTASMDSRQIRAERVVGAGRVGVEPSPIRLGPGEIMPERAGRPSAPNFTLRGSVPAGQSLVPTHGFDPAMKGATSHLPEPPQPAPAQPGIGERVKAGLQSAKGTVSDLRAGANAMFSGQATPTDWKSIGKDVAGKAKAGLGKAMSNFNTFENAIGAGSDLGMIAAAPNADVIEKFGAGAEALGNVAVGGLVDGFNRGRGLITGAGTSIANGATNARPVTQLARLITGRSAIDNIRANNFGETSGENPFVTLGGAAKSLMNPDPVAKSAPAVAAKPVAPLAAAAGAAQAEPDIFTRRADPEAELARQVRNFDVLEGTVNADLAARVRANGGRPTFRDAAAQEIFNAKQALNGSGISVSNVNGTPTFTGDNRAGGGQLYRAADGSVTNDWSKTQAYADAIQRNAKDQDRLAELTRGAALSGDKEALARLTVGDSRLEGIAAEAGTEKSLRDAVKRGSRNAAVVLADMEKSKATQGMAEAELGLKRAALVGAQEDRDLNRQLRQDTLNARLAENQRAAAKDARESAQSRMTTLDKQLEQYATVDGKVDGQKLARLRGLAANLQPSPGQSPEEFNKDVTTLTSLASKLDDGQAWYDKLTSQAGLGGTDMRQWKQNTGLRGGFVTDQGDHISTTQYNSLTDDEKAAFKKFFLKGGK